jgi:hypothetical protein
MPAAVPSATEKPMLCCVNTKDQTVPLLRSQLTDGMNGNMLLKCNSSYLGSESSRTENTAAQARIHVFNVKTPLIGVTLLTSCSLSLTDHHKFEGSGQSWKATSLLGSLGQGSRPRSDFSRRFATFTTSTTSSLFYSVLMQTASLKVRKASRDTERA